jgi:hypothetical protein
MSDQKRFTVVNLEQLQWPVDVQIPTKRFRLFVAGDISRLTDEAVSSFALSALERGMVYFCAWGPDCSRFDDLVDWVCVMDELDAKRFVGPSQSDVIMTTWHANDTLEEALDFFASFAIPTDGFAPDSDFRLVVCLSNPEWENAANRFLASVKFFR